MAQCIRTELPDLGFLTDPVKGIGCIVPINVFSCTVREKHFRGFGNWLALFESLLPSFCKVLLLINPVLLE